MVSWWIGNAVLLVAYGVRNVRALRRAAVHLLADCAALCAWLQSLVAIHRCPDDFRRGQMPRSELCRTPVKCLAADS